jgi:hypothetical protein
MVAHPTRFVLMISAIYIDNKVLYLNLGAWHNAKRIILDEIFKFGTFNALRP